MLLPVWLYGSSLFSYGFTFPRSWPDCYRCEQIINLSMIRLTRVSETPKDSGVFLIALDLPPIQLHCVQLFCSCLTYETFLCCAWLLHPSSTSARQVYRTFVYRCSSAWYHYITFRSAILYDFVNILYYFWELLFGFVFVPCCSSAW